MTPMDHLARIQAAIDYIEDRLREPISVSEVARAAGFSPWHFQRVFSSMVGQTLKEYIRKRRLTSALVDLGSTDKRIIDIALDYQFESQESFSRSFKVMFHRTPGECRKEGIRSIVPVSKPRITYEYLDHLYGGITMQPRIVALNEKKVVGFGARFISVLSPDKNNDAIIPPLWDEFHQRKDEIPNRIADTEIGYCEAVPVDQRKHTDECFYLACTEVNSVSSIPDGMTLRIIPPGRYAVFTHRGNLGEGSTVDQLGHTYSYIYGSWLPKSGEELREAPDFEYYDHRFKNNSDDSEMDIYIPIK
jgi:AraC family transcriptional regulator